MKTKQSAFTIVELLTVMGIIAILLGLLVPALNQVQDKAKNLQQIAQFHAIETGLEMFKTEFGEYPESSENLLDTNSPDPGVGYSGTHKLAEAMVGLDFLGYHPASAFAPDGMNKVVLNTGVISGSRIPVYSPDADTTNWETADENINNRGGKVGGTFIELDNANARLMTDVFPATQLGTYYTNELRGNSVSDPTPVVLCDVYTKKRPTPNAQSTGMPILYFKANTQFKFQDYTDTLQTENDIYNLQDNMELLVLGTPSTGTPIAHPLADGSSTTGAVNIDAEDMEDFEKIVRNDQIQTIKRPYRAGSYILISAGKDGLYGNADDIMNFGGGE